MQKLNKRNKIKFLKDKFILSYFSKIRLVLSLFKVPGIFKPEFDSKFISEFILK